MALRGKKPEEKDKRLKMLLFSPAGIGKTMAAIQMPNPYIIDTEAGTSHYGELIEKSGGSVWASTELIDIIEEVKQLATTKHNFRTLVIDPITIPYEAKMEEGATDPKIGDDYGKHIAYANRYMAALFRLLGLLDMNVVVTSHAKLVYKDGKEAGVTFDGWKKLDYIFDLALELQRRGNKRVAVIRKTRLEAFPDQETFDWSFEELARRAGEGELIRAAAPVEMASKEQFEELKRKVKAMNVSSDETDKWLTKEGITSFSEMTAERIGKYIDGLNKKLAEAEGATE